MTDTPSNDTPPPNEPNTPPSARDTAIAVTFGFIFGFGLLAYKIVSAPAKAAANATEFVTEAVKSSASATTKVSTTSRPPMSTWAAHNLF